MTEVSQTEDAMITAGNEAKSLLDNEVFNRTIDGLVQSTFQGFVNSAPENNEERKNLPSLSCLGRYSPHTQSACRCA